MRKLSVFVLAFMLILTGCFGENSTDKASDGGETVIPEQQSNNKKQFNGGTVLDLKKKYGSYEDKAIMPMYNVEPNKIFMFEFQSDLTVINPDSSVDEENKIISVHTDIKAHEESRMSSLTALEQREDGKTIIRVEPIIEALALDSNPKGSDWGSAPIYYLKVSYDLEAEEPTKLEKPMIIPFTIKSEVATPTLYHEISTEGRLKLVWDAVDGVDKYNVYQIKKSSDLSNFTNTPISGAEMGYDGLYPFLQATVTGTEFMDWYNDGDDGLGYYGDKKIIYGQNLSVRGDYFVTAVKDNKESLASNFISSAKIGHQLPQEIIDDSFEVVQSANQLPITTKLKMVDGSEKDYNVIYHINDIEFGSYVPYTIQGTALKGEVAIHQTTTKKELASLVNGNQENSTSARVEPKNETDYVPSPDVPTIIETASTEGNDKTTEGSTEGTASEPTFDTIIEEQKENTEKIVEEANKAKLPSAPKELPLNADSAFEEYLALNMLEGNDTISLEAFPEAQNFETITDTLLEVMYQNSLIIGVEAWDYDYKTLTLKISYNDTPEEIMKMQEEIVAEAQKIVADIIHEGMSDEEKREAIYRYLADNTSYDHLALEAAEANNFQGNIGEEFDDSFTTYGIMVKKVGVCMSYAYSYKLLGDLVGIESIVVTGVSNGVPHAWNKVKIGNEWLHIDVTNNNNEKSLGFRLLYNANDVSAVAVNSILTDDYWRDTEITQFYGKDNSNDYYVMNGLEVSVKYPPPMANK